MDWHTTFTAFRPKELWHLVTEAASDWSHDRAPRLGAALAFYTVFSIVPLLVIIIAIIGLVFGQEAAQGAIMAQIATLLGDQSAAAIKEMIQRADEPSSGILSTVMAIGTLIVGATVFFGELQDALNTVWGIEPKEGRGIAGMIKDRLLSFVTILGTGFLLLVSLILSTALSAFGKWFGGVLPLPEIVLQTLEILLSLAVITGLFALIFKVLPDAHIAWRDVWVGAVMTAVLFTLGKFAIGLYLGKSEAASAYGAAGSFVIVLIWVYYSAQILLFGAEFTQVYANRRGERIVPSHEAQTTARNKATPAEQADPQNASEHQKGRAA
jgi:membrane protein